MSAPEIAIEKSLGIRIADIAKSFGSIDSAEDRALRGEITQDLAANPAWLNLCDVVRSSIRANGYIILRGLEVDDGRSLLLASRTLGLPFDTYAPGRIVKRFRMSPWTNDLSHTTKEGDFHTDGNVAPSPPVGTAMQCELEDPGAPDFAEQRVAFLPRLLEDLQRSPEGTEAIAYLRNLDTVMTHEKSHKVWAGPLLDGDTIRYHPHTLRVAARRQDQDLAKLERVISTIHQASLRVSIPFHTAAGDTVLVSNRTALHYRGECSVRFKTFPMDFDARSLFVLHLRAR